MILPSSKAITLFIVTAFIGKKGYKKEASQLINAKSLDVTAKTESANASGNIIAEDSNSVKMFSERDTDSLNRVILENALESVAQNDIERNKLAQ